MLQTLTKYCITAFALGFAVTACTQDGARQTPVANFAPEFGLFFVDEGASAKLAYGQANSDNVGLMLECAKGSRLVRVTDVVRSSPAPRVILASGGARTDLKAETDAGVFTATAPATAPALAAFRRSGKIEVSYAGLQYGLAAKANERAGVERFFSACEWRQA